MPLSFRVLGFVFISASIVTDARRPESIAHVAASLNPTLPCNVIHGFDCSPQVCNVSDGRCVACRSDTECDDRHLTCDEGQCRAKTLKESFDFWLIAAIAGAVAVCGVAGVAGVGGGGILVPLFAATLGVPLAEAVALSQATITGQSFLTIMYKLRQRHPQHNRQLINWTLMTFWLPASLAGTMAGNLIGKTVPDWFRIVLLLLLLSYVLARVVSKALAQRQQDREKQSILHGTSTEAPQSLATVSIDEDENDRTASITPPPPAESINRSASTSAAAVPAASPKPLEKPLLGCREIIPMPSLLLIAATFLPLIAINYVKSQSAGLVTCNSDVFWSIIAGALVYTFMVTVGVRYHLRRVFLSIIASSDVTDEAADTLLPFKWNRKTNFWFPMVAMIAGAAASLLGIGGGLILGVLFLEAGLTPEEVSATSGAATLLVAAESFTQYIIQGVVPLDYGVAMSLSGLVGSVVGIFLQREIKRRGLSYLIVVCLATIMGGSMVALTADGAYSTWYEWKHHKNLLFRGVCHQ